MHAIGGHLPEALNKCNFIIIIIMYSIPKLIGIWLKEQFSSDSTKKNFSQGGRGPRLLGPFCNFETDQRILAGLSAIYSEFHLKCFSFYRKFAFGFRLRPGGAGGRAKQIKWTLSAHLHFLNTIK